MITKHEDLWHLYFYERCADDPVEILLLVEALFKEIAEMGSDIWYLRGPPTIEHFKAFAGEQPAGAVVFCRFSCKPPVERETPKFLGLGPQ